MYQVETKLGLNVSKRNNLPIINNSSLDYNSLIHYVFMENSADEGG